MKKVLFIVLAFSLFWSCNKDLTDKNTDQKNPVIVPSYTLFANAQKQFADLLTTCNVNTNIFRLFAQHWTETTYLDESNYDISTRDIPVQWFNGFYRDVLKNLEEAKTLVPLDVADPVEQKNDLAMIDLLQVYGYYYLVTTFGNIPYSEALDIEITQPKYDDAATIYSDLLTRLDADITALDDAAAGFGSGDLIYGGDIASWKRFANSLKVKMAILLADVDPATAKSAVESAAPNVFTSNADNAVLQYLPAPPNSNPAYVDQIQSGRGDFVATSVLVNPMKASNDPRMPAYFSLDANGSYSGGAYGEGGGFATFSKPKGYPDDNDPNPWGPFNITFPGVILSYAEVEFYLAEAAARGYNVGGTAEEHYNAAIVASIEEWDGTPEQAATYLAQPAVAYATAAGDWKQKIGTQEWIAFYNRGYEAWTTWRSLDVPDLVPPPEAISDIPVRFLYPSLEQNLNKANVNAASAALGPLGDDVTTKLWFDKN
jgi:hypothetical protein